MIEQKSKTIKGITYLVNQFDGVKGLEVQTTLLKLLSPILPNIKTVENIKSFKIKSFKDMKGIFNAISNFNDKELNNFILSLFDDGVFVEKNIKGHKMPERIDFAEHFRGKPLDIWPVAWFILEANFDLGELNLSSLRTMAKETKIQENLM